MQNHPVTVNSYKQASGCYGHVLASMLGSSKKSTGEGARAMTFLRGRKPVSPAVAVRLGKLFGDGAGVWTRMQAAYDTWHAERQEDVSGIPTIRARVA